jgi:GAF domain-containing protein
MFEVKDIPISDNKREFYASLAQQLTGLLEGERDMIANAANMSALINQFLPSLNWAGFYFMRGGELVLGPFQGKTACVRIAVGRGVCGTAVERRESIVVPDVHAFPGHIACDSASRSELVVPIVKDGRVLGVLDLDSPNPNRFDDQDRQGCERLVQIFLAATDMTL